MTDFIQAWLEEHRQSGAAPDILAVVERSMAEPPMDDLELLRRLKRIALERSKADDVTS
jgi:hypothetical protein